MSPPPKISSFSRIVIVGTTGSGKTTFARRISERYGLKRIELDAIQWLPGWREIEKAEFVRQARELGAFLQPQIHPRLVLPHFLEKAEGLSRAFCRAQVRALNGFPGHAPA